MHRAWAGEGDVRSRLLRVVLWSALGLAMLWGLAWLAVPPLLKWQLERRGSEMLGRELRVEQVRFAPFTLELTLQGLSIAGAAGDAAPTPQLRIERLRLDLSARSLLRLAPVLEALDIDAPRLRLAYLGEGRTDVDDLRQRFAGPPPDPKAEPARFALFNLRLADGEFRLDDRAAGRSHVLGKIRLDLPFLSNLPDDLLVKVEPRLDFEFNGSAFQNRGRSTPFAQGRASELDIRFDALDLSPLWVYVPATLPVRPEQGRLSAQLQVRFQQPEQGDPRVEMDGTAAVRDFGLKTKAGAPLFGWRSLELKLVDLRPLQRRVALESVQLDGALVQLRRDAQGRLELQSLVDAMAAAGPRPVAAAAAQVAPEWQVQIDRLTLSQAQVNWSDASLQPTAEMQLDGVDLQLQALRWPVDGDSTLQFSGRLAAQGQPRGQVQADGKLSDQRARVGVQLSDIDLALAEPYLRQWLRPQASARLQAKADIDWARGDAPRLLVGVPALRLDDFRLAPALPGEPRRAHAKAAHAKAAHAKALLQWSQLELGAVQADLLAQQIDIGSLRLQRPAAQLARDAQGRLSVLDWLQPAALPAAAPTTPAAPQAAAAAPWRLALRELSLEGGRLHLTDAALPAGPLELSELQVRVQGLAWPLGAPLDTRLATRLTVPATAQAGGGARLDWRGRVALQPQAAEGELKLERFPVHFFEPYFGKELPVRLQRLEAGFQGRVAVQQQPQGPSARLRGDALLADLQVLARGVQPTEAGPDGRVPGELVRWNALNLNRMDVSVQPGVKPRIEIGELSLADFFARLEIDEQGQFNLQTVAARPKSDAPGAVAAPAPAAVKPPEAGTAGAPESVLSRLPVELLIESMQFSKGRIDFDDRFVRPNYRADLSDLKGRVGRLDSRSRDMATLQFDGRVAGTGLLEIGGALNPTVIPPALDIKAKAHDIELPGLTPYSSKYAGYPIERGKLSVDVAYKIEPDGKLEASNQIIVNQLTFGPKTDSPNATKLPVPLLVALLQDKNGVIDLDLPLTGSVNDPKFNLGALIWKVIVNLFTKAASSPFSVIGGGGKDLSHVDFVPGTAQLAQASDDVVAKVAKALQDRPGLKLGIVGTADPVAERAAMQRAAFEARLREEQRRERARGALGSTPATDAPLPPLDAEQRTRLVRQVYSDTRLPDKPRNLIGMAKDIPVDEMEAMLVAAIPVDEATARQLAVLRARTVRDALTAKGLGGERLFLGDAKLNTESKDNGAWVPQAQLTLSAS